MSYRKSTLRKLPPMTRKVARLINELESTTRRLDNLLPLLASNEYYLIAHERREKVLLEESKEGANDATSIQV
jgi:hypothetical protein